MAHLHDLVEEAITITSSTSVFDYNDDDDHKDNYSMPMVLVSESQEFVWSPLNTISIFGTDDKAKAGCV